ncbi:MAG TPA: GPW/gp25 family protein [Burkholderiaceae bacterium]|nr:GPW/gp25 family protein [Burkholderiaceae bacterium]
MATRSASTVATRAHLGVGWAFPVRPVGGRLAWSHDEDDVEQAVEIILRTSPGERVMLPAFGAGLDRFLFAANSPQTHRRVEEAVRRALVDFEPRITVERVEARASAAAPNLMEIEVDYVVRRTNGAFNRVFPFYLNEAE